VPLTNRFKQAIKRFIFGPPDFPQQCPIEMHEPQSEVIVRLNGWGAPRDVTHNNMMVCGAPFTIGIGSGDGAEREGEWAPPAKKNERIILTFHEHNGSQQLLGEIELRFSIIVRAGGQEFHLFQTLRSRNLCLPRVRIWARYLEYAYYRWRATSSDVSMSARDVHSMCVFYICPRPIRLVSVTAGNSSNVFPMNLLGPIGNGYFSLALTSGKPVTSLLERAGRIALCSVPVEKAEVVYALARNHKLPSIDISLLPFATRTSAAFGLPVPEFSLSVRELEIEAVHSLGSHTLFLARTIRNERWADAPEFFTLHGIYKAHLQLARRL
jgi:flavin reductase (DIM6/NTAB) family NADH-FMN oxidoreductase RutF